MLMQVELLKNPRQAIVIPEEALVPQGKEQFVLWVDEAKGNRVIRRPISIGARRPGEVEVLQGLEPGMRVITQGAVKVRPGQQVIISAVSDGSEALRELLESSAEGGTQL